MRTRVLTRRRDGDGPERPAGRRGGAVCVASLQLEHDRRAAAREERIRTAPVLAAWLDPESAAAARAVLERRAAAAEVRALAGGDVRVLTRRRLGRGRRDGELALVAVGPSGVVVVDVQHLDGAAVQVRRRGGVLTPRREELRVADRDAGPLVQGLARQRRAVVAALREAPVQVPVRTVLCLVGAVLPRSGPLSVDGVAVLDVAGTGALLRAAGPLGAVERARLHVHLGRRLPPA